MLSIIQDYTDKKITKEQCINKLEAQGWSKLEIEYLLKGEKK